MKYSIRPGIVRRDVAGETMLFAVGEALEVCTDMEQLNDGAAYYWALIEQGMDEEQMLIRASEETGEPVEDLRPGLKAFLKELQERGYVWPSES